MQSFFKTALLASAFSLLSTLTYADAWIDKVQVRYKPEETFKRISEYFTGKENQGNRLIVRIPNDERAGLYWIIQLDQSVKNLPEGAQLRIDFFRQGSATVESRTYPLSNKRDVKTIFAGITGNDWKAEDPKPTAWRLEVLDKDGQALDTKQSYLWRYPQEESAN